MAGTLYADILRVFANEDEFTGDKLRARQFGYAKDTGSLVICMHNGDLPTDRYVFFPNVEPDVAKLIISISGVGGDGVFRAPENSNWSSNITGAIQNIYDILADWELNFTDSITNIITSIQNNITEIISDTKELEDRVDQLEQLGHYLGFFDYYETPDPAVADARILPKTMDSQEWGDKIPTKNDFVTVGNDNNSTTGGTSNPGGQSRYIIGDINGNDIVWAFNAIYMNDIVEPGDLEEMVDHTNRPQNHNAVGDGTKGFAPIDHEHKLPEASPPTNHSFLPQNGGHHTMPQSPNQASAGQVLMADGPDSASFQNLDLGSSAIQGQIPWDRVGNTGSEKLPLSRLIEHSIIGDKHVPGGGSEHTVLKIVSTSVNPHGMAWEPVAPADLYVVNPNDNHPSAGKYYEGNGQWSTPQGSGGGVPEPTGSNGELWARETNTSGNTWKPVGDGQIELALSYDTPSGLSYVPIGSFSTNQSESKTIQNGTPIILNPPQNEEDLNPLIPHLVTSQAELVPITGPNMNIFLPGNRGMLVFIPGTYGGATSVEIHTPANSRTLYIANVSGVTINQIDMYLVHSTQPTVEYLEQTYNNIADRRWRQTVLAHGYIAQGSFEGQWVTGGNLVGHLVEGGGGGERSVVITTNATSTDTVTINGSPIRTITVSQGSSITIEAVAGSGRTFAGWSGAPGFAERDLTNPITVTVNTNLTIDALFTNSQTYTFTLNISPSGSGSIRRNGVTLGDTLTDLVPGTVHTFEAVPSAGYEFDHWEISNSANLTQNPVNVTANDNRTITAVFVAQSGGTRTVEFNINGGSGPIPSPVTAGVGSTIILPSVNPYYPYLTPPANAQAYTPAPYSSTAHWRVESGVLPYSQWQTPTEQVFRSGEPFTVTADMTLYMAWIYTT